MFLVKWGHRLNNSSLYHSPEQLPDCCMSAPSVDSVPLLARLSQTLASSDLSKKGRQWDGTKRSWMVPCLVHGKVHKKEITSSQKTSGCSWSSMTEKYMQRAALCQFQCFVNSCKHSSVGWWAIITASVQPGRETFKSRTSIRKQNL